MQSQSRTKKAKWKELWHQRLVITHFTNCIHLIPLSHIRIPQTKLSIESYTKRTHAVPLSAAGGLRHKTMSHSYS